MISFSLVKGNGKGPRLGTVHTPHGDIETPAFMPVGTQATVKALTPSQVAETGASIMLSNTYHLYLRPGSAVVRELGGLHKFMNWDRAILTDSGGFQVFSLSEMRKITDKGVTFKSHIDGSSHFMGPEESIGVQHDLGADIIMCFDECIAYPASKEQARAACARTTQWAKRCKAAHEGHAQALFGIVQGSVYEEERVRHAEAIVELDFPGYAIGGLSVGEPKHLMAPALSAAITVLPPCRPRYLMGVGTPEDIMAGVREGVDMFDCVLPSRVARHATALTHHGKVLLRNKAMERDESPIEEGCDCYTCRNFSRAYIRHLFKAAEPLALTLATLHNLRFMQVFMADLRKSIANDRFDDFCHEFEGYYGTHATAGNGGAADGGARNGGTRNGGEETICREGELE